MRDEETLEKISELTAEIGELPKGYISKKTINGTVYYYHQWSENGAKQSRYLHDDEIEPDRKSTRLNSSHRLEYRMPSSA